MRDPNLFHTWLSWLRDLGGTYEPVRDLDEKKPYTGRRDPDKKPEPTRWTPINTGWTRRRGVYGGER